MGREGCRQVPSPPPSRPSSGRWGRASKVPTPPLSLRHAQRRGAAHMPRHARRRGRRWREGEVATVWRRAQRATAVQAVGSPSSDQGGGWRWRRSCVVAFTPPLLLPPRRASGRRGRGRIMGAEGGRHETAAVSPPQAVPLFASWQGGGRRLPRFFHPSPRAPQNISARPVVPHRHRRSSSSTAPRRRLHGECARHSREAEARRGLTRDWAGSGRRRRVDPTWTHRRVRGSAFFSCVCPRKVRRGRYPKHSTVCMYLTELHI